MLDTPNLKLIQNIRLKEEIESRCNAPVCIENDANLFALGEWHQQKQNSGNVFGGITLGVQGGGIKSKEYSGYRLSPSFGVKIKLN